MVSMMDPLRYVMVTNGLPDHVAPAMFFCVSFLQYRKFRRNLEEQIQRHGIDKVAAATSHQEPIRPQLTGSGDYVSQTTKAKDHAISPATSSTRDYARGEKQDEPNALTAPTTNHDEQHEPIADLQPELGTGTRSRPTRPQSEEDVEKQEDLSGPTPNAGSLASSETGYETEDDHERDGNMRPTGTRLGTTMTGVSVRSRDAKDDPGTKSHIFIVGYQGENDKLNPHNWSTTRRLVYTMIIASIGLVVGLASSIDSAAIPQAAREFGVSEVTESLATGLYLVGFGCGAFFAAPISETIGRNLVYLSTGLLYMIFIMASGLAPNIGAQLVFRLLAGFFGSTPLTCAGGSISDLWNAEERTKTFPIFANSAFWGPIIGPIVGGWIAQSSALNWRWCEWITLIWSGLTFAIVFFFLPETYAPVLLKWKAQHMRELTGDKRYMSTLEAQDTKFWDRLLHNFSRPWLLLFYEPIVILFTLYLSVVYIILFTFLTGFEFIFEETYGLSQGLTFTIFVVLGIGFLLASTLVPWVVIRYHRALHKAKEEGRKSLEPEQRLIFAMIGAPFLPIGIFWMGWTAYPSISMWSPIAANLPVGFAIISIFISTYQYLIDAFEVYAASALVGLTFVRYVVAGGMIPVSIPFYQNLGVHWTLTILGAIAAIMAPVPYVFYFYGARIRKKSRHAVGKVN